MKFEPAVRACKKALKPAAIREFQSILSFCYIRAMSCLFQLYRLNPSLSHAFLQPAGCQGCHISNYPLSIRQCHLSTRDDT